MENALCKFYIITIIIIIIIIIISSPRKEYKYSVHSKRSFLRWHTSYS